MEKTIGAQLYTIRTQIQTKEDFEKSMEKIAQIGYKAVQVSGIGPIEAEDVKKICDKYGLKIACTHRSLEEFTDKIDFVIDYHKTIGCNVAGLGFLAEARTIKTKEEAMDLVNRLNAIAKKLKDAGIEFAVHNHAAEFMKLDDGKQTMEYLLEYGEFSLIVDVYWLAIAGIDPAKFLRKYKNRISMIHYKDLRVDQNEGKMAYIGEGNLDWDDIIKASNESAAKYALVEQDECYGEEPFECLEKSYNYLTNKGFI